MWRLGCCSVLVARTRGDICFRSRPREVAARTWEGKTDSPAKTEDVGEGLQGKVWTETPTLSCHSHGSTPRRPPLDRSIDHQVLSRLPSAVVDEVLDKTELAGYFDSQHRVTAEDEPFDDYRGFMLVSERLALEQYFAVTVYLLISEASVPSSRPQERPCLMVLMRRSKG